MQKIISWNVASVRARLPVLLAFLKQEQPDVVMLQEIKATEETFPYFDFQVAGYAAVISGQKGYNGVAILTKHPIKNHVYALSGFEDQARFVSTETENGITLISVYVPNGNPPEKDPTDTTRLDYKLRWMNAFNHHIADLLKQGKKVIIGGDFNVIERDTDVYNPDSFRNSALMLEPVRKAYADLNALPIQNMVRHFNPEPNTYSFWDFQGGAWFKNNGILLDAIWVSDTLTENIQNAFIYKDIRALKGTSDHAPVGIVSEDIL